MVRQPLRSGRRPPAPLASRSTAHGVVARIAHPAAVVHEVADGLVGGRARRCAGAVRAVRP